MNYLMVASILHSIKEVLKTLEENQEEPHYLYNFDFDECKYLLMNLRKAIQEFDDDIAARNDTKSSLDKLEFAQGDLYEYVEQNIPLALDQNEY